MSVMMAGWFIFWVQLFIYAALGFRHRHRYQSPRLIHQREAHKHHSHHYPAKQIDYDRLLEKREIAELFSDNAYAGYDNYYDQYFEEMDATVEYIVTQANVIPGNVAHILFQSSPNVKPPYIQVHYPTDMTPAAEVFGPWQMFTWHAYEKEVDKGIMTTPQIRSVYDDNSLRKQTQLETLKWAIISKKTNGWKLPALAVLAIPLADAVYPNGVTTLDMCLNDLGSKTAKSDLDFTYIFWPEPLKVVPTMILFYNKFHQFYGDWPLDVYDMNLYIACGLVKDTCVQQWPVNAAVNRIKALFTAISNPPGPPGPLVDPKPIWELGSKTGYKNDKFFKVDMYMAYLWVKRRLDLKTLDEKKGDAKLKVLTQYSAVFYWYLNEIKMDRVKTNTPTKKSNAMLFLKAILYAMNYWSDESYVTNSALQLIFKKAVATMPQTAKFLAVLDCTAFITRYDKVAETKKKSDLWFFDKISKYMMRNGKLLQTTPPFTTHEDKTTSNFPDKAWNFFKKDRPVRATFNEDKIGLKGYDVNYFGLAEQWSGAWDGDDGRVIVGNSMKKIRGDVPLAWVKSGHVRHFKIWTRAYNDKYVAWMKYKKSSALPTAKLKILTDVGVPSEDQMLIELAYADDKRHRDFIAGQYADLGRLFFRARKIWDWMKDVTRWAKRQKVVEILTAMVAKVEQHEIKAAFKDVKKVAEVEKIVKAIQDNVNSWVEAKVTSSNRKPDGVGALPAGTPKTKVLSFAYKSVGEEGKKAETTLLDKRLKKGIFNYFNDVNTQKILQTE